MREFRPPVHETWWIEGYMQEEGSVVWKGRDRQDEVVSIIIVKLTTKERNNRQGEATITTFDSPK